MKTKILVLLLLASGVLMAGTHVVIGVGVGGHGYYAPPPVVVYTPPYPGPGYYWTPGYWYRVGYRSMWRAGYWAPRPHYFREGPRFYRHDGFREHRYDDRRYRDRGGDRNRYRGR